MPYTDGELDEAMAQAALRDVRRSSKRLDEATERFHLSIRQAGEHASQRLIATAAGLSPTRVNQIIHGRSR